MNKGELEHIKVINKISNLLDKQNAYETVCLIRLIIKEWRKKE